MTRDVMADLPRCLSRERWLKLIGVLGAIGWIGVGWTSSNEYVAFMPRNAWLLCTGLAAGSAFALARWGSLHALQSYTIIASAIAVLRAAAYAEDGIWGPTWVWMVLICTTVAFYVAFAPHLAEHQRQRLAEKSGRRDQ